MLKTIYPNSEILKNYIEYFYVFEGNWPQKLSYLAFPHYFTGVSFFKDIEIKRSNFQVEFSESAKQNNHIEILGKYLSPVRINYQGKIKEVSIIFKPLGINRFLKNHYLLEAPMFSQSFNNKDWLNFGETFLSNQLDLNILEEFLLSELNETKEISEFEKCLSYFHHSEQDFLIGEIADNLGINLKTFQRHFTNHIGCSPVEYRRICRFRNSIDSKISSNELKSLTEITFENNFFDQSYFIKEFKKLTQHNPKDFFKVTHQIDGKNIIWEIL